LIGKLYKKGDEKRISRTQAILYWSEKENSFCIINEGKNPVFL